MNLPIIFEKKFLLDTFYGLRSPEGSVLLKPKYDLINDFDGTFFTARREGLWFCFDTDGRQLIPYRFTVEDASRAVPDTYQLTNVLVTCTGLWRRPVFTGGFALVRIPGSLDGCDMHIIDTGGQIVLSAASYRDQLCFTHTFPQRILTRCPHPETAGAVQTGTEVPDMALSEDGVLVLPEYRLDGEDAAKALDDYAAGILQFNGLKPPATRDYSEKDGVCRYTLDFGGLLCMHVVEEDGAIRFSLTVPVIPCGAAFTPGKRILLDPRTIRKITAWQQARSSRFYTYANRDMPPDPDPYESGGGDDDDWLYFF